MPGFELVGKEERDAVNEIFDDGGILFAHGFDGIRNNRYRVREFEKEFAKYIGAKYALAVTSGTAAIKVALIAMGIKPGDEIITQAFTFVATVEAIIDLGAIPVIVNIDDTLNMDAQELEIAITNKTKAIIPVHMLGVAADLNKILPIAKKHGIPLLDDNCEALGADWEDSKLGVQSDICTWSFDSGKVIITGEGGMITTNNEKYYKIAMEYHDHGHMNDPELPRGRDTRKIPGFNYRMTELQAAVGLAQLKKLDYIVETNRKNYNYIYKNLININGLGFRKIPKECEPLCDCLMIVFPEENLAKKFVSMINKEGLGTKNVPDAIEWHFARYWDHIFSKYGLGKNDLKILTNKSAKLLNKSVAIPISLKESNKSLKQKSAIYRDTAISILS